MPVETKSSPISFSIGPFAERKAHLPLWSNGILHPTGGSSSSEGNSSRSESPDLTREVQNGSLHHAPSLAKDSEGEPEQVAESRASTSTTSSSEDTMSILVEVGEKPALPPRPTHLSTSSKQRRRSGQQLTPGSSSRPTLGTPTSPTLTSSPVLTEKEYIERIAKQQMDTLIPLKEDVSGTVSSFTFSLSKPN